MALRRKKGKDKRGQRVRNGLSPTGKIAPIAKGIIWRSRLSETSSLLQSTLLSLKHIALVGGEVFLSRVDQKVKNNKDT